MTPADLSSIDDRLRGQRCELDYATPPVDLGGGRYRVRTLVRVSREALGEAVVRRSAAGKWSVEGAKPDPRERVVDDADPLSWGRR